jgi:hypothetical protein
MRAASLAMAWCLPMRRCIGFNYYNYNVSVLKMQA